jgi:hypothetical protein
VWRREERDGKSTKVPYQAGAPEVEASSTRPQTWGTYTEACAVVEAGRADGIGFVFTVDDPYTGIDLDGCRDPQTGARTPKAEQALADLDSYCEVSPSGRGVHIIVRARLAGGGRKRNGIEIYDRARYFTVTGHALNGSAIHERQGVVEKLYASLAPPSRPEAGAPRPAEPVDLDDRELLEVARRARNGARFARLYDVGDWAGAGYESQSEADLALCNHLAFWTGRDAARMDRLVRGSALIRDKWDESVGQGETHGARCVRMAVEATRETYSMAPTNASEPPPPPADVPKSTRRALEEVVAVFRRWLHLPDPGALLAVLGAVVANRGEGDPVWLALVAPPGHGKTEILTPLAGLPDVYPAATLTEAALLSGTAKRDMKPDAKGGLLRQINDFGIIVCKDFGSVLSMDREGRGRVLAALREVYDGSWTRYLGVDGGKALHWEGKVGFIAGCTGVIDSQHAVLGAMGDRLAFYRLPEVDPKRQTKSALARVGREKGMRDEFREAVAALLADAGAQNVEPLSEVEIERMIALATLAVTARSAVERDRVSREIELILGAEAPARLATMLVSLLRGIVACGATREEAWRIVTKTALDCIPAIRRTMLDALSVLGQPTATPALAEEADYPTTTAKRALEELTVYGLASRVKGGQGKPDLWWLTDYARELRQEAGLL